MRRSRRVAVLILVLASVPVVGPTDLDAQLTRLRDAAERALSRIGDAIACAVGDAECIADAKAKGEQIVYVDRDGNVVLEAPTVPMQVFEPPNDGLLELPIPVIDGLPRLGLQDTRRIERDTRGMNASAIQDWNRSVEFHVGSYVQLLRTRFMTTALEVMDREGPWSRGAGMFRPSGAQQPPEGDMERTLLSNNAQDHFRAALYNLATDETYEALFCSDRCAPRLPSRIAVDGGSVREQWGGGDEFAARRAFQAAIAEQFEEVVSWSESLPDEFFLVSGIEFREYDFDAGGFHLFVLPWAAGLGSIVLSQEAFGGPQAPTPIEYLLRRSPDEAESLVDRVQERAFLNRTVFGVFRARFVGLDADPNSGRSPAAVNTWPLSFEVISPEVRLYADEALTDLVSTVTLPGIGAGGTAPDLGGSLKPGVVPRG